MFTDAITPGERIGPAQVVLEYELPLEALTKYSASAHVKLPALFRARVTLVGELTLREDKTMLSFPVEVGPQLQLRQTRVCWGSAYKTKLKTRTAITTMRILNSFQRIW